jgi:hypothetical protein
LRGVGIHLTKLEDVNLGPAVNPIQNLYSKRKQKEPRQDADPNPDSSFPRIDEIDPDILRQMPLEIQQEYARASSSRDTRAPPAFPSSVDSDVIDLYQIEEEAPLGSQIDMSVFQDLPADIQQEIRQQYILSTTSKTSSTPIISASQLNSKSLLDKNVLDELPEKIQREVRAIIRLNRIEKRNDAKKISPVKRKAEVIVEEPMNDPEYGLPRRSQIDREVYNSLPIEIQNDINAELRKNAISPPTRVMLDNESFKKPMLGDASEIKDVLRRLDEWLTLPIVQYSRENRQVSPPRKQDVEEIRGYLETMVERMWLSEVKVLMERGDSGVSIFMDGDDAWVFGEWIEAWSRIRKWAEGCIERKYGGRLKPKKTKVSYAV